MPLTQRDILSWLTLGLYAVLNVQEVMRDWASESLVHTALDAAWLVPVAALLTLIVMKPQRLALYGFRRGLVILLIGFGVGETLSRLQKGTADPGLEGTWLCMAAACTLSYMLDRETWQAAR